MNYGRVEDLARLAELGVSLSGRIALSRYGKIFRGNRLSNCQTAGATGVIMFSDPADVAPLGTGPDQVYPNTFFLPESGMQRGSVKIGSGDPLSPSWPSVAGAYRLEYNKVKGRPLIPSQPIGYGDAQQLLAVMGGQPAPADWQGGLNLTYRLGGGWAAGRAGSRVRLTTHNTLQDRQDSSVLGLIRGVEEPDRY